MTEEIMTVTFAGGKRVDVRAGDVVVHTDQSRAHGGDGSAPEPFTLFLASLAACAAVYVQAFCDARAIPTHEIRMWQKNIHAGGKLVRVELVIELPPDFPPSYVESVKLAASSCRVKRTIASPPEVDVQTLVRKERRPAV